MSGTYRATLVYTKDGHYGRGNNARTAAAEMRKIDRRKKRREAGRIKREAMREYEADIADAQEELLQMAMEEEYGHFGDDWEGYDDPMPEPYDYCYEHGYFDDYADYEEYYRDTCDDLFDRSDYAYADSYYASQHLSKEGFSKAETTQSSGGEGLTLGEALERAISRVNG